MIKTQPFVPGMNLSPEQIEDLQRLSRIKAALDSVENKPKKEKTPTYNFTLVQIEQIKQQTVKESVQTLIELTLGLPVMVMHDKHGWGQTRLERLADQILELYDSYEKEYLTLEDIRKALWEEAGVRIQRKDDGLVKKTGGKR